MLTSLNKEPTCFKNPNNPSCIDLFYTNRSRFFQNTSTIETGTFEFHKLVVTMLNIIQYKNYKTFNEELFRIELDKELSKIGLITEFHSEFLSVLNNYAPVK